MRSPERTFLLTAGAAALAVLGGFAAIVATMLLAFPPQPFVSYREYLFDKVPGPRIVFDGGSNVLYSIDAGTIEQHFNLPTIVVADHAGVPLEAKVTRLEHYLQRGDTLILPLEWPYYVRDYTEPVLARHGFWMFRHYLDAMPVRERLAFAFTNTRPGDAMLELLALSGGRRTTQQERIADFQRRANTNPYGAYDDRPEKDFAGLAGWTCAQYVFLRRSKIVPEVARAAERLGKLQASRKARIVVTWPSVAGERCYDDKGTVERLASEVRGIFEAHGITVLATPDRSYFPGDENRYDTFYHLTPAAAALRTRRLIEDLEVQKIVTAPARPGARTPQIVKGLLAAAADASRSGAPAR